MVLSTVSDYIPQIISRSLDPNRELLMLKNYISSTPESVARSDNANWGWGCCGSTRVGMLDTPSEEPKPIKKPRTAGHYQENEMGYPKPYMRPVIDRFTNTRMNLSVERRAGTEAPI